MMNRIRDLIRKRREVFKKVKRTGLWQVLKAKTTMEIDERKRGHWQHVRQKFAEQKNTKKLS